MKRKVLELDPKKVVVATTTTTSGIKSKKKVEERSDLDRLLRLVTTTIRRAGKVAKSQEILKVVKRLKKQKSQHEKLVVLVEAASSSSSAILDEQQQDIMSSRSDFHKLIQKSQKKIESLERRLYQVKQLEMDELLKVCMKRLGVKLLGVDIDAIDAPWASLNQISTTNDVSLYPCDDKDENPSSTLTIGTTMDDSTTRDSGFHNSAKCEVMTQAHEQQQQQQIVETLLLHKNLSTAMDLLNTKITDYRRQLLLIPGEEEIPGNRPIVYRRDRKKARQQQQHQQWSKINKSKSLTHEGPGSMFVESLSGEATTTLAQFSHYGPGAKDFLFTEKKNRPGQRARRAKAIVQQAKKEGKEWDSSVNWREPKSNKKKKEGMEVKPPIGECSITLLPGLAVNASIQATDIALMGKDWKENGKAHPSWLAAKARQTHGMTEFKGKKITF